MDNAIVVRELFFDFSFIVKRERKVSKYCGLLIYLWIIILIFII